MIAENITGHAYGGSAERSIPAFGFRYSVTDLYNDIPEQVREAAATTSRSTWRGIHERIVESERQCGLASRNGRRRPTDAYGADRLYQENPSLSVPAKLIWG
jgi:hypothetical protein